jgi:hypothetical protein
VSSPVSWLAVLGTAAVLSGCGTATPPEPAPAGSYIALKRDFADFAKWEPFPVKEQADGGNVHLAGARTVYLNERPPAGSTTWPVGTVVVKKMDDMSVDPATGEPPPLFAMVKRGAGFNLGGAVGWEWFGLALGTDGQPLIEWRGLGPPSTETYGASQATCNACHAGAGDDAVMSLRLADVAR